MTYFFRTLLVVVLLTSRVAGANESVGREGGFEASTIMSVSYEFSVNGREDGVVKLARNRGFGGVSSILMEFRGRTMRVPMDEAMMLTFESIEDVRVWSQKDSEKVRLRILYKASGVALQEVTYHFSGDQYLRRDRVHRSGTGTVKYYEKLSGQEEERRD